jgi:hypothetical protein
VPRVKSYPKLTKAREQPESAVLATCTVSTCTLVHVLVELKIFNRSTCINYKDKVTIFFFIYIYEYESEY